MERERERDRERERCISDPGPRLPAAREPGAWSEGPVGPPGSKAI